MKQKKADVGVVVGRFQVDDLHAGHKKLLQSVADSHEKLIIMVGLSPCKCTYNNPLDFASRQAMLHEHYPDATIMYIKDVHCDKIWSDDLDSKIETLIGPGQSVCLYGSRDSFIPHYFGKFPTKELVQESFYSGTEIRKKLAVRSGKTRDFRAGAIWAMANQWPAPKFTIDVAIFDDYYSRVLLGRKKMENEYRFIGGFVGNGEKLSETVRREAYEEANLSIRNLCFIGSFPSDDWRYAAERDKITTVLYSAMIAKGTPKPGDDIYELRWFEFNADLLGKVVPNHVVLVDALLNKYQPDN